MTSSTIAIIYPTIAQRLREEVADTSPFHALKTLIFHPHVGDPDHPVLVVFLDDTCVVVAQRPSEDEYTSLCASCVGYAQKAIGWVPPAAVNQALSDARVKMKRKEYDAAVDGLGSLIFELKIAPRSSAFEQHKLLGEMDPAVARIKKALIALISEQYPGYPEDKNWG